MASDGTYTGVVDAIEDDIATVFLEADGDEVDDRLLNVTHLPEDARHQDAIVAVTIENDEVVEISYDADATDQRREAAQNRFDRLSKRPPDDG